MWQFSPPVCLAPSVEAMWTPPTGNDSYQSGKYLRESLWMACGTQGVKVGIIVFLVTALYHRARENIYRLQNFVSQKLYELVM